MSDNTERPPRNPRRIAALGLAVFALAIDCAGIALVWLGTGMGTAFSMFGLDQMKNAETNKQFITGFGASAVAAAGDVVIAVPGVVMLAIGLGLSTAAVMVSRSGANSRPDIGVSILALLNAFAFIMSIAAVCG